MSFTQSFLNNCTAAIKDLNPEDIDAIANVLAKLRDRGGRLFLIGSGGGAGHSSHAVCDFRKLCNIDAYAPYDNVSELTARINDDGWDSTIVNSLKVSRFGAKDGLFVFSVGGGDENKNISVNLVKAVQYAKEVGASVVGVVGKNGGYTKRAGDAVVVVPTIESSQVTPLTEGFQALIWHLLVSHPLLQVNAGKWESVDKADKNGDQAENLLKALSSSSSETKAVTKIFADGANKEAMLELYKNPNVEGFTTNPTLMRKAGVQNYCQFAKEILEVIKDKPISFEVFADQFDEMEAQAKEIASWGENVYVKIPITNTKKESSVPMIHRLAEAGVKVNVTAMFTLEQVKEVLPAVAKSKAAYLSIFAGRIADTGVDPVDTMKEALEMIQPYPHVELLWASPREILNLHQAREIGCHVITVTDAILKKLHLADKDHTEYSLDTVKMFYNDAQAAQYSIETKSEAKQ